MEACDVSKKSITLVSYRKTDDYFNNDRVIINTITGNNSSCSTTSSSTTMAENTGAAASLGSANGIETSSMVSDTQTRLSLIKADLLAAKISTPVPQPASMLQKQQSTIESSRRESMSMKDAIEAKIANTFAASASDLLFSDRHASSDENSVAKRVNDLSVDLKQVVNKF